MIIEGYQVRLRSVAEQDLEQLRQWRNLPEIRSMMLAQEEILPKQQQAWFARIQNDTAQQHFVIEYRDEPIGAANIKLKSGVALDKDAIIEPGLYIGDKRYRNNILAFAPTLLLNDYCFNTLKARALEAVVKANNINALKYNQKLGYEQVASGDLVTIRLTAQQYAAASAPLKRFFQR